jgi:hypothetical protein
MFELMSVEIHQAHRERELAAELDRLRLLRTAAEATRAEPARPTSTSIPRRVASRVSATDR